MAVPLAALEESGLVETRAQRRRNPKGKKARKAAARLAQAREAKALLAEAPEAERAPPPRRKGKKPGKAGKAQARGAAGAVAAAPVVMPPPVPNALPAEPALLLLEADPLLDQCLAAEPALALTLPVRSEPLVSEAPARILTFDAMPELVAPVPEAGTALVEPEPALAEVPLPRALALVPARRQGLVDVIAFLLRDSGRRLARWSARRHKSKAEREALRRAEARQINLQRELEALDALRSDRG